MVGNSAGHGLALIAGIIVARFLGKEVFGEYGMIKQTLVYIAVFSTFGLGYTATKFIAEAKNKNNRNIRQIVAESINITLITSVLFALLLFVFSKQIAAFLEAEHLALSLRIFAVNVVFNALATVQIGILAGFKAFKQIAKNNAIVGVTTFVLSVVLTYFWGIEGALSALLFASLFSCVLNNIAVRKNVRVYPYSEQKSDSVVKQLFAFSLPIALQEGMHNLTVWLQIVLLVKLTNYGEVGLFSAAHQWMMAVLFIPGVLKNVALSHLAEANDDKTQHKKVFNRIVLVNFTATLIPCLLVFALSGIITSFYGVSFARLPLVLNIAVFSAVFLAMQHAYIQNYLSANKVWTHFSLSTFFNVLTLVLAFLLISRNAEKGAEILVSILLVVSAVRLLTYHLVLKVGK